MPRSNGVFANECSIAATDHQIAADAHFSARENITSVADAELGGPLRMQNVAGKFSATPGAIRWAGPRAGEHNREVLIEGLGLDPAAVRAAGIDIP